MEYFELVLRGLLIKLVSATYTVRLSQLPSVPEPWPSRAKRLCGRPRVERPRRLRVQLSGSFRALTVVRSGTLPVGSDKVKVGRSHC